PPDDRTPPGATRTVVGTVGQVQQDTMQFLLKPAEGKELIIAIDGRTTVQSTGRNMNWFDLAEGMNASIIYAPKGGQLVAISIQASKATPPPTAPEPAPKETTTPSDAEPITIKGKIADIKS